MGKEVIRFDAELERGKIFCLMVLASLLSGRVIVRRAKT